MKVSVEERNTVVQVGATAIKVKLAAPVAQDAGVTDHGALSGLADDDHPHYALADGTRPFTGPVSGEDPTEAEHLATRSYVDDAVSGASGTTDHGALDGLADDDHPHYALADGTRPFTGAVSGQTPTEPEHLVTRSYVDPTGWTSLALTGSWSAATSADWMREPATGRVTLRGVLTSSGAVSSGSAILSAALPADARPVQEAEFIIGLETITVGTDGTITYDGPGTSGGTIRLVLNGLNWRTS